MLEHGQCAQFGAMVLRLERSPTADTPRSLRRPLRRADKRPALSSAAIRLTAFSYDRCPVACLALRAASGQMLSLLSPGSVDDLACRNRITSSGALACVRNMDLCTEHSLTTDCTSP